MSARQPMTARYAAKRLLQATFAIVAAAGTIGAASAALPGLAVFLVGVAGFIAVSYIPAKR